MNFQNGGYQATQTQNGFLPTQTQNGLQPTQTQNGLQHKQTQNWINPKPSATQDVDHLFCASVTAKFRSYV